MEIRFAVILLLSGAITGCASDQASALATIPAAPAAIASIAAETLPLEVRSTQAPIEPLPTSPILTEPTTPFLPEPSAPIPSESPGLLGAGELHLQVEIPIVRSDFGVRFAFSPTEEVLLHSGSGLQIQRVDWGNSQSLDAITGFENFPPITISLSPDGSTIVADDGPLIRVWDLQSGAPIEQLQLSPISTIIDAGFQADDVYFAVDFYGNVALWDPNGWDEITRFSSPGRIDSGLLFPGGQSVALQDRNRNEILILDLSGQSLGSVPIQDQFANLLFGSPQADRILMHINRGLPSEGVKIISVETGEPELELPLLNYRYFAVSNGWEVLAAMDVFNRLRIYSLPDGELLLEQELEGVVRTLGLTMSPSATHLAAYVLKGPGEGGAIQVWGVTETNES
ncbi:MAG: hypothetical protein ACE5JF_00995 [Anaerolineales bacterium]